MNLELGKHDARVIAGRSDEQIRSGIRDIMGTQFPGAWERKQLELLKAERDRRACEKLDSVPRNIVEFPSPTRCPACKGRGFITGWTGRIKSEHKCNECKASGWRRPERTVAP